MVVGYISWTEERRDEDGNLIWGVCWQEPIADNGRVVPINLELVDAPAEDYVVVACGTNKDD